MVVRVSDLGLRGSGEQMGKRAQADRRPDRSGGPHPWARARADGGLACEAPAKPPPPRGCRMSPNVRHACIRRVGGPWVRFCPSAGISRRRISGRRVRGGADRRIDPPCFVYCRSPDHWMGGGGASTAGTLTCATAGTGTAPPWWGVSHLEWNEKRKRHSWGM